ncbi:hypothetical protein LT337_18855 [Mycolicibacterium fortuitum]|nr:hypothetical protein LT337_18855 [Mycolicibacterium fortuitum]
MLEFERLPVRLRISDVELDLPVETFVDAGPVVRRPGFSTGAGLSRIVFASRDECAGSGDSDPGGGDATEHRTPREFSTLVAIGLGHVIGVRFHVG